MEEARASWFRASLAGELEQSRHSLWEAAQHVLSLPLPGEGNTALTQGEGRP